MHRVQPRQCTHLGGRRGKGQVVHRVQPRQCTHLGGRRRMGGRGGGSSWKVQPSDSVRTSRSRRDSSSTPGRQVMSRGRPRRARHAARATEGLRPNVDAPIGGERDGRLARMQPGQWAGKEEDRGDLSIRPEYGLRQAPCWKHYVFSFTPAAAAVAAAFPPAAAPSSAAAPLAALPPAAASPPAAGSSEAVEGVDGSPPGVPAAAAAPRPPSRLLALAARAAACSAFLLRRRSISNTSASARVRMPLRR